MTQDSKMSQFMIYSSIRIRAYSQASHLYIRSIHQSRRRYTKMASEMSLDYTQDRAEELKENIDSVLHDIDAAYTASGSSGPKVSYIFLMSRDLPSRANHTVSSPVWFLYLKSNLLQISRHYTMLVIVISEKTIYRKW